MGVGGAVSRESVERVGWPAKLETSPSLSFSQDLASSALGPSSVCHPPVGTCPPTHYAFIDAVVSNNTHSSDGVRKLAMTQLLLHSLDQFLIRHHALTDRVVERSSQCITGS
jgi:hypothetical protein